MDALSIALIAAPETSSAGPLDLGRYVQVCVALVALILGVGWLLRRFVAGSIRTKAAQRSLQVVDVLPLGGRRQLTVVRCYDRVFALGVGEKEVSLLAELEVEPGTAPEEAPPELTATPAEADRRAFARELARVHGNEAAEAEPEHEPAAPRAAAPQGGADRQAAGIRDRLKRRGGILA